MKGGKRLKIAAGAALTVVLGAALSFGPLVRAKVDSAAERFGATVVVESVRPRWNGATLRGVTVKLEDAPSLALHLDEVIVDGALGSARTVVVRGGEARAAGRPEELAGELGAVRDRLAAKTAGSTSGGTRTSARVEGLRAHWERAPGSAEKIDASGIVVAPGEAGVELEVEAIAGTVGRVTASAKALGVSLQRSGGAHRVRAFRLEEAFLDLTSESTTSGEGPEPGPGGPPEPAGTPSRGSRREELARAVELLRARGALILGVLDERLTPDASPIVEQLTARLRLRGEVVSIGPGRFEVRREEATPRKLVFELARAAGAGDGDRLTARLSLPLGEGAASAPIRVEMHGGPIPVAALGLREGDLGLIDPGRASLEADATLELDDAAQLVRFDGEGHLKGLSLQHRALSDRPLEGIDVGFRGKVEAPLDASSVRASQAEIELGALRVLGSGKIDRTRGEGTKPDELSVDVKFEVPLVACQSVLDAAPAGLFPVVAGSTMAGSLALTGHAVFDTAQLDKTYDVAWNAAVGCRMVAPRPQAAVERFQKPFKKTIYTPEGARQEAEFGPGTDAWVPRSRITHLMEVAVITAEDGRFERHGGFDHEAIRNSIRENIRARRFVRGASTISMQLAKNLYLPRDKTLSRKLEEAILTLYLEQVLTKDQMMELYLNVVEFGPMVYGIGPAARHYFRTSPEALTVSQCYYLASILPSPKKQHFSPGGAVSGGWMSHLRRLMKYAHRRGRLTDQELDEGMTEVPVFGSSSPIREAREEAPLEEEGGVRREPWADAGGDG